MLLLKSAKGKVCINVSIYEYVKIRRVLNNIYGLILQFHALMRRKKPF